MVSANGIIVLATFNCSIIIHSDYLDRTREIKIPSKDKDSVIHNVFIDYTGSHIVVSLASGENWYQSAVSSVLRKLKSWKGLVSCGNLQALEVYIHICFRSLIRLLSMILVPRNQLTSF